MIGMLLGNKVKGPDKPPKTRGARDQEQGTAGEKAGEKGGGGEGKTSLHNVHCIID